MLNISLPYPHKELFYYEFLFNFSRFSVLKRSSFTSFISPWKFSGKFNLTNPFSRSAIPLYITAHNSQTLPLLKLFQHDIKRLFGFHIAILTSPTFSPFPLYQIMYLQHFGKHPLTALLYPFVFPFCTCVE